MSLKRPLEWTVLLTSLSGAPGGMYVALQDVKEAFYWRNCIIQPSASSAGVKDRLIRQQLPLRHSVVWFRRGENWVGRLTTLTCYALRYVTEWSPSWKSTGFSAGQGIPPHFVEQKYLLPFSQEPSTCLYPDSNASNPRTPPYWFNIITYLLHGSESFLRS